MVLTSMQGNFGKVYAAKLGNTKVVVKEIKDQEYMAAVEKESKMLEGLRHPFIVSYLGVHVHEGKKYLLFEYMDKGSLQQYLRENLDVTDSELIHMALDAAKVRENTRVKD